VRDKALVKQNVKLYLDNLFLENGLYTNISVGQTDFYGNDISLLAPGDVVYPEPDFISSLPNKVFQSAFKNWVYESGISLVDSGATPPVIASGVTVDGTFYSTATTSGTYAHSIDFPNGRIIFDSPLAGSPIVQSSFSYKEIFVGNANLFKNEQRPALIETSYKDNPAITGVAVYPSVESYTLPGVFIDVLSRENSPYELGTRAAIKDYFGVFHIWARDDFILDDIEEVICDKHREVLVGINFNSAPDPLLINGVPNPDFTTYDDLATVWGPHFWRRIYLENLTSNKDKSLFEIERSRINFDIRVYPNF
jgi:hypothetical protein